MMIQLKRFFCKHGGLVWRLTALILGVIFTNEALATTGSVGAIGLSVVAGRVTTGVKNISTVLEDVAIITGVGFVMASFFKFHQHKLNPTQVPMSQGITLLAIGAGLAVFPHMLNTATSTVFGTSVAKVGSSAISQVIAS